jgi:hypothetical protein
MLQRLAGTKHRFEKLGVRFSVKKCYFWPNIVGFVSGSVFTMRIHADPDPEHCIDNEMAGLE